MATHIPYNDSVFLFRLQTLIIDGGTEVVRNVFNNRLNNLPLITFLANDKRTINGLKAQRTISNAQYEKLFPPGGQQPDSGDFDITLLICLLRSIPSLGLNMTYPWHTSPRPTDTSIEADLIRLRTFRNEIAHASSTHCLVEPTYNQQWNKVEQCLLRLNSGLQSDPNLQATIDSFKNSPLDPATKQRLEKQWQELETFLESEINIIKEDMIYTRKNIGEVTGDVCKVKGDVAVITEDIWKVKRGISNLKRGIGKVEGDIHEVTGDVDKAREDMSKMKGDICQIGGRVDNLEEQVQNLVTKLLLKQQRREDVSQEAGQSVMTNPTSQQRPSSFLGRLREKFRRKRKLKRINNM